MKSKIFINWSRVLSKVVFSSQDLCPKIMIKTKTLTSGLDQLVSRTLKSVLRSQDCISKTTPCT